VKNSVIAFNLSEFLAYAGGNGAGHVISAMTGKNYSLYSNYFSWNGDTIAGKLTTPGVWYVNSHGNPQLHYTNAAEPEQHLFWAVFNDGGADHPYSYDYKRFLANGFNFPPFNDTGNPYVAFAQLDNCNNGTPYNNGLLFESLLFPFFDGYGELEQDQAVIAWPGITFIGESQNLVWWITGHMASGWTAAYCRFFLVGNNSDENHPVHLNDKTNLIDSIGECTLIGDPFTRVKGVYTHTVIPNTLFWWRHLN